MKIGFRVGLDVADNWRVWVVVTTQFLIIVTCPMEPQVSLPKMFQIVAMWLVFRTEELCAYKQALNAQKTEKHPFCNYWLLLLQNPFC